ncbi:MAG: SAM-dependent DNA methyltransferase [Candidatus Tectomicrobia bacterium]|nr:SAM-dependent DNA methyltransferase [Candidatus Tectomicrobia bacterium]
MKGFVPTPEATVDAMVERLFRKSPPRRGSRLLDPGCGHGAFIEGVFRWCRRHGAPRPEIAGIEMDPGKIREAKRSFRGESGLESFDYIVGNPPYVAIEKLSEDERARYRRLFNTARGRLDLYLLFWERALGLLRPGGRLVFITPEKFAYVETARPLREILSQFQVEEIFFAPENTFPGLTTYPTVTTVGNRMPSKATVIETRNGERKSVRLPQGGGSWQPIIHGAVELRGGRTLEDLALRVSCGVATGADGMFVLAATKLPSELQRLSYPTLAGRELRLGRVLPEPCWRMLMPYDQDGRLLPENRLAALGEYLARPEVRKRLEARTCVQRKPWYAFHETPCLKEILRPKLLCKDVTLEPFFWIDRRGDIIPRHSVYYVVPHATDLLEPLAEFLNSAEARSWLRSHCQRAANGFLRVQSSVLKKLPVPDDLGVLVKSRPVAV